MSTTSPTGTSYEYMAVPFGEQPGQMDAVNAAAAGGFQIVATQDYNLDGYRYLAVMERIKQ